MAFVEISNVRKVFSGGGREVVALDEANLSFGEGEFVALLGPSGCGKTTLLKIVSGLISKTSGSVTVAGQEVTGPYSDYGFVFQQPSLMPWRTVRENVLFPMEILKRKDAAAAKRALIHKPRLLLMDEPFGALDEFTRLEMNDLLLKVKDETKASVLFVTHSISEAIYLSDKVVVFSRRPARVHLEFNVALPGPRSQATRFTPEFTEAERRASEALGLLGAH